MTTKNACSNDYVFWGGKPGKSFLVFVDAEFQNHVYDFVTLAEQYLKNHNFSCQTVGNPEWVDSLEPDVVFVISQFNDYYFDKENYDDFYKVRLYIKLVNDRIGYNYTVDGNKFMGFEVEEFFNWLFMNMEKH